MIQKIYWNYCRRHYAEMRKRGMGDYVIVRLGYLNTVWISPDGKEFVNYD